MDAPKRTVAFARGLRRRMSPPELRLWVALRGRAMDGVKFRRQHPMGPYILDFFSAQARLAIEVDGMSHLTDDHPARDERRDAWVEGQGVRTLRVGAVDVRDNLEGVVDMIVQAARSRMG